MPLDRFLQTVAADEFHRVERPAVGVGAEAVDRHDRWVFEAAGNFSFPNKSIAIPLIVGESGLNLLQRYFAIQFQVDCKKDFPQSAAGMRPCGTRS